MELVEYLSVLRKGWKLILLSVLLCAGLAAAYSFTATKKYTGTTSVYFSVEGASTASELASGSTYAERQVKSYAQVATSPLVLDRVIKALGLQDDAGELQKRTKASVPTGTVIIEVAVTDPSPQASADIANAVAEQLTKAVHELSPKDSKGNATATATVIRPAVPNDKATSPKPVQNIAIGLVLGLLLGAGGVILKETLDTKVRSAKDIELVTKAPIVGSIPFEKGAQILLSSDAQSPRAEAYRRLRTNIAFLDIDEKPSSFVVTSSVPGEGKSTTSTSIALTMAEAGQRVLLVEADLRRPAVAKYLGLETGAGLTTLLVGRAQLEDLVQPVGSGNLEVLTAGPIPPNPSELLGSRAMRDFLARATEIYDTVILDCPPLLPVTDAAVLAGEVGGVLLVAGNGIVRKPELETAIHALERVDADQVAIIHNRVAIGNSPYRYNYNKTDKSY